MTDSLVYFRNSGLVFLLALLTACGGGGGGSNSNPNADDDNDGIVNGQDIDDDNDGLIEIASLQLLDWMRNDPTGTSLTDHNANATTQGCPNTGCMGYELVADLNFDTNGDGVMDAGDTYFDYDGDGQNNGWLPIGSAGSPFTTVFEGNNRRISNLYINRPASDTDETSGFNIGLFGRTENATISNLGLDGALMQITGDTNTGGLAGLPVRGTSISNSFATGNVTGTRLIGGLAGGVGFSSISNSNASGDVTGTDNIGGLVGLADDGTSISDSNASGSVTGSSLHIGGLVGRVNVNVSISNSFATGNVIGVGQTGGLVGSAVFRSTISDAYATGDVTGSDRDAGGLVGRLDASSVTNSYATGDINGRDFSGGLVGAVFPNSTISDSYATGNITGSNERTGGLAGAVVQSTVTNSYATGSVSGGAQLTGGLVGLLWNASSITGGYATGPVVGTNATGGLVGSVNIVLGVTNGINTNVSTISDSFATGAVSTSGNNNYVGGLIGISYHMNLSDTFATGAVSNANRFVGGLNGDANMGSVTSRSFSANTVSGAQDVGAFIGWNDGGAYTDNYFANNLGLANAIGTNNSGGGVNPAGTNGDTLANLQAVTTAGNGGFTNWGNQWDFGNSTQLPGLIINGTVYRDGDANGVLD